MPKAVDGLQLCAAYLPCLDHVRSVDGGEAEEGVLQLSETAVTERVHHHITGMHMACVGGGGAVIRMITIN